jgi:hypothetical protein
MKVRIVVAIVCVAMLAVAAPAFAESPAQTAYSGTGATQVSSAENTGASLPFTGINVTALGAIAVVLLGTGFVLRRTTRARTH